MVSKPEQTPDFGLIQQFAMDRSLSQAGRNPFNAGHNDLANHRRERRKKGAIQCRERLGGLLKYYEWQAA
jgi:hypothetical protein